MIKNRGCIIIHGFLLAIVLLSLLALVFPDSIARADTVVNFPDPNLQAAIRLAINELTGDIHQSDLAGLTAFSPENKGITDLTGLEYCTSLTYLYLDSNQIGNISSLSGLTRLTRLNLNSNQISDISPLSGLTSLVELYLDSNQIGNNTSPLSGLSNLQYLGLSSNQIGNISPLSGLANLTSLDLGSNQIGNNTSPLSGLTRLTYLYLSSNQIGNVEPLVNNSGLAQGDTVDLRSNPLSSDSTTIYIPTLQGRGVQVLYDQNYTHPHTHTYTSTYTSAYTYTDAGGGQEDKHRRDYWPHHCGDSDTAGRILVLKKKEATGAAEEGIEDVPEASKVEALETAAAESLNSVREQVTRLRT